MTQNTVLQKEFVLPNTAARLENINEISKIYDGDNVTIDISTLNILDASHFAVMCATNSYVKNPNKKINFIVSSNEVFKLIKPFNLGNINIKKF